MKNFPSREELRRMPVEQRRYWQERKWKEEERMRNEQNREAWKDPVSYANKFIPTFSRTVY